MNPFLKRVSLDSHYWIYNLGYSTTTIIPLTLVSHILQVSPCLLRIVGNFFFHGSFPLCIQYSMCGYVPIQCSKKDAMEHCKPRMCGARIISTQLCFVSNFHGKLPESIQQGHLWKHFPTRQNILKIILKNL